MKIYECNFYIHKKVRWLGCIEQNVAIKRRVGSPVTYAWWCLKRSKTCGPIAILYVFIAHNTRKVIKFDYIVTLDQQDQERCDEFVINARAIKTLRVQPWGF